MFNSNSKLAARPIGYQKFAPLPEPTTEFEAFAQYQIKLAQDRKILTAYNSMMREAFGTNDPVNPGIYK